jgi:hypothetical protein
LPGRWQRLLLPLQRRLRVARSSSMTTQQPSPLQSTHWPRLGIRVGSLTYRAPRSTRSTGRYWIHRAQTDQAEPSAAPQETPLGGRCGLRAVYKYLRHHLRQAQTCSFRHSSVEWDAMPAASISASSWRWTDETGATGVRVISTLYGIFRSGLERCATFSSSRTARIASRPGERRQHSPAPES